MRVMIFAPIYIIYRLFYVIGLFLRHWYVDSFYVSAQYARSLFLRMDRSIAVRVTFLNFFEPLYQDYTILGYIYGFIFRSLRLLVGTTIYLFLGSLAILLFGIWLLIPIIIGIKLISSF